MKFSLKDIVFAAITSAAMNVVSFITVPLVIALPIPGIRTIVVAPFYGLLLAIALMKIGKPGALTLVALLAGGVLVFISPAILAFLVASGIVADLCYWLFLRKLPQNRGMVWAVGVFMAVMVPFGILFGALLAAGTSVSQFLTQPLLIGLTTVICFILGSLGGMLGVKIGKEFQGISLMK